MLWSLDLLKTTQIQLHISHCWFVCTSKHFERMRRIWIFCGKGFCNFLSPLKLTKSNNWYWHKRSNMWNTHGVVKRKKSKINQWKMRMTLFSRVSGDFSKPNQNFEAFFFLSIFFYSTFFCCVKRRHTSESICWNQWKYLHLYTAAVYNWQNNSNSDGLFALWLCYSHSFPEISFRPTLIIGFQDSKKN